MHDRDILGRADRHERGAPGRLARLRPAARAAPWDGVAVPDVGMAVWAPGYGEQTRNDETLSGAWGRGAPEL